MSFEIKAMSLMMPGIMLIFALAFAGSWYFDRRRTYILGLTTSCLCFALGALTQTLGAPRAPGLNALVSGAFYTGAVIFASQALVLRTGRRPNWIWMLAAFLAIEIALWYFYYVDRALVTRIYIQNFSYGAILFATAMRIRKSRRKKLSDACVFYILLAFSLHFFPRTIYFMVNGAPIGAAFLMTPFWRTLMFSLTIFGAALAITILFAIFSDVIDDLRKDRDIDSLTSLLNRRGFKERVDAMLEETRQPLSLIVCDIDRFKQINDRFGHAAGDIALVDVAQALQRHAPPGAVVGRQGGEEFAILLKGSDLTSAAQIAERMRTAIASHTFDKIPDLAEVTASFGVAERKSYDNWDSLLRRADELLYCAKRQGRNRMVAEEKHAAPKIYAVS